MELSISERVRVPKTAELVAQVIRSQIVRGELTEGDALPPESELTGRFGISRPTLREALRILESESLITLSRGSRTGAIVHAPSREVAARHTGLLLQAQGVNLADVYEARVAIFAPAARVLAERGGKAHAKALRTKLDELRALQGDPSGFLTGALEFNHAVLELAGNRTLTVLAGVLSDIVALHLATVARDWETQPRHAREAVRVVDAMEHLIELIEAGDGDAAERFWRAQMEQSARYSLDHYGRETVVDLLG
jgi:GntR family transcriptional repressor for pyruvate dehydrogenase complex